jgi:hypothetical protein
MRRFLLLISAFAAFSSAATAEIIHPVVGEAPEIMIDLNGNVLDEGAQGPRVVARTYDDWTSPGTTLQGLYASGASEVGDNLNQIPVGAGWLDNMGVSVANANGPVGSTLTGGGGTIRFYSQDANRTFIGGFNFTMPALSLGPGFSARLQFSPGALKPLNLFLPQNVWVTTQFTTVTGTGGFAIANAGVQVRNPPIVGSSTDVMWDRTADSTPPFSSDFNFGGAPVANMAYYLDTDNVPEPATLTLLGLGALAFIRRR